ncbi:MAG: hypothetical protein LBH36_02430 [Candidatus Nomurabacteria bacterium]|jgi:uncharacterized protein|nr:hypothetical protein [Candidatus Nomurabacteria bacterium]
MVSAKLKAYVEQGVLPIYNKNEEGHGIDHVNYVLRRAFKFNVENDLWLSDDMLYAAVVFHDVGHHIDPKNHEVVSAEMFIADKFMNEFFSPADLLVVRQAIEDHRSSADSDPRNIYGEVLSSADRNTDLATPCRRTYAYTLKNYPNYTLDQNTNRAYDHISKKFGPGGYANEKIYFKDDEYTAYLQKVAELIADKPTFVAYFKQVNGISD